MRKSRLRRLVLDALTAAATGDRHARVVLGPALTPREVVAFIGERRRVWPCTYASVWWILFDLEQDGTVASEWVDEPRPRHRRYWLTGSTPAGMSA